MTSQIAPSPPQPFNGSGDDTSVGVTIGNGGAGNDGLFGTAFGDILNGGNDNDFLGGFAGNDTLNGGPHNDVCAGVGAGETALDCEVTLP